jgi:hypothetical protein
MLTKIFDDHSLMPTIISIAYIFANGGYGGSATFSELLVNFYVLLWMLLICIAIIKKSNATAIAVGAVMAISFHTNYLTGVYILLLTIAIPASAFLAPKNNKKAELEGSIKLCSLALIGFSLSSIVILMPIIALGNIDEYFRFQIGFLGSYSDSTEFQLSHRIIEIYKRINSQIPILAVIFYMTYHFFKNKNSSFIYKERIIATSILIIFVSGYVSVLIAGRNFSHYYLLTLPGLIVLSGALIAKSNKTKTHNALPAIVVLASCISIGSEGVLYSLAGAKDMALKIRGLDLKYDSSRVVSSRIKSLIKSDETVYVACAQPVIYQLIGVSPPTRFAFYPHHLNPEFTKGLGTTVRAEINSIMAKKPEFIIIGPNENCLQTPIESIELLREEVQLYYSYFDIIRGDTIMKLKR